MKQLIIFVVLCLPLLYSCGVPQQQETDTAYKTLTIKSGDQILKTGYTATLRGRQNVEIRPQVSGIITEICINEGDAVHKGQTLFIIDQIPYKAALQTAIANVKSAEAKLATAKLTADSKAELYKEQVVSEFDLQTARNEQIAAEAALAQAKAQEVNARNNLSYTVVKSPSDGVIAMLPYRVGALVGPSIPQALTTVSDNSDMYVYFSLTENELLSLINQYKNMDEALKNMPEVELKLIDGSVYGEKGRVESISGVINRQTGTVGVRAVFPNASGILHSGASGSVLVPNSYKGVIVIPQEATVAMQDKISVYKVVDGKATSTLITVAAINDGREYIVLDGLKVGDEIVSQGAGLLREGTQVK